MTPQNDDFEPQHAVSSTGHVLTELQLFGYRPFQDEPDPRPLPDADRVAGAAADAMDAFAAAFNDTRLEPDLERMLWSMVNLAHRAIDRIERELDTNEQAQKASQKEQDGSEIRSVELERRIAEGQSLIERRNCMEFFRDQLADQFERQTRTPWRPRSGSRTNHRTLTAAVIDSRDFVKARACADHELLAPKGALIAVSAGADYGDHGFIFTVLDKIRAKYPDMVLAHGATRTGGEHIAALWAEVRNVPHIPFSPDWKLKKAAPFKRNDRMLEALPKGVVVFPGNGIQDNLYDKAKVMGIHCWDFRSRGGG